MSRRSAGMRCGSPSPTRPPGAGSLMQSCLGIPPQAVLGQHFSIRREVFRGVTAFFVGWAPPTALSDCELRSAVGGAHPTKTHSPADANSLALDRGLDFLLRQPRQ